VKPRTFALASALLAAVLAATVVPARLAGAAPKQATARLVSVHVTPWRAGPRAATRAPVRTEDGARLSAAGCNNPGPGTSDYSLSGSRVNGSTVAHFNPGRIPAGVNNPVGAMQAAFNTWKAAEPAAPSIRVASDGTTVSPTANHRYDLMFKRLGTSTLAVTYSWRWSTGEFEHDTVFNKQMPWFQAGSEGDGCYESSGRFDLQNVATHEFGHTYGLSHSGAGFNTMAPSATTGETYKRSLASGDINGIRAVY
jgi:matrixin